MPKSLINSPDARKYPFVLGFKTKDISKQQEHGLKKELMFGFKFLLAIGVLIWLFAIKKPDDCLAFLLYL